MHNWKVITILALLIPKPATNSSVSCFLTDLTSWTILLVSALPAAAEGVQAVAAAVLLTVVRRTTALPTATAAAFAVSAVAVAAPLLAATTPPAIVLACGEGSGRLHNSDFSEKKFALQIHVDFFTFYPRRESIQVNERWTDANRLFNGGVS